MEITKWTNSRYEAQLNKEIRINNLNKTNWTKLESKIKIILNPKKSAYRQNWKRAGVQTKWSD